MIQKYFEIEADQRMGLKYHSFETTHDNNGKRYPIANPQEAQSIGESITDVWYDDPKKHIIATINSDESVTISVAKSLPFLASEVRDHSDPIRNNVRDLFIGTFICVIFFILIGSLPMS